LRVSVNARSGDSEDFVEARVVFRNRGDVDLAVYNPFCLSAIRYAPYRLTVETSKGLEVWDTEKRLGVGSQIPPGEKCWISLPPRASVGRVFRVAKEEIRQNMRSVPNSKKSEPLIFSVHPYGRLVAPKLDFAKSGRVEGSLRWWAQAYADELGVAESNPFQRQPLQNSSD
jgi:hypothetical protein